MPLGTEVGTALTRVPGHLAAEEEGVRPCTGSLGSGGGRQGLGSDDGPASLGLGHLGNSGHGYVFKSAQQN